MRRLILPCTALLALATAPATAQTFTGPRAELNIGYDRLDVNDRFPDLPSKVDGIRLGGAAGYDIAVGSRFVVGAEVGAGWTFGTKTTATIIHDRVIEELQWDLDVSGRAGLLLSPRTLAYGKIGYASSRFGVTYDEAATGGYTRERYHATRGGLRLGAGLEQSLGNRGYIKVEYRWTHYPDHTGYLRSPVRHQVLLGVGTRF